MRIQRNYRTGEISHSFTKAYLLVMQSGGGGGGGKERGY